MQFCGATVCLLTSLHEVHFCALKIKRKFFIFEATKIVKESHTHAVLFQSCNQGHSAFMLMLQAIFKCFAKNELKKINQYSVQPPEKMKRGCKLNSKTSVQ